jgi:hypothetical protein
LKTSVSKFHSYYILAFEKKGEHNGQEIESICNYPVVVAAGRGVVSLGGSALTGVAFGGVALGGDTFGGDTLGGYTNGFSGGGYAYLKKIIEFLRDI